MVKRKPKALGESCNATITRVLNTSGANYKINLNRVENLLLKFHLIGSSGSLTLTNSKGEIAFFYTPKNPPSLEFA